MQGREKVHFLAQVGSSLFCVELRRHVRPLKALGYDITKIKRSYMMTVFNCPYRCGEGFILLGYTGLHWTGFIKRTTHPATPHECYHPHPLHT